MKISFCKDIFRCTALATMLVLPVFLGCKPQEPGIYVADKNIHYSNLNDDDILVKINGAELTKKEFEKQLDLRIAIFRMLNSQVNDDMALRYRSQITDKVFGEWQTKELLAQRAKRLNLSISDEVKEIRLENMATRLRKKLGNPEDAKKVLGDAYAAYDEESQKDLLINEFYRHEGLLNVDAAQIEALSAKIGKYNARALATNALVVAKGTNIVNEIKAGLDFAVAFAKYNEDKELDAGGDMGWCFANEIAQEEIKDAVFAVKPGSLLGPFDCSDGLYIIKVTDYSGGGPTAGGTLEPPKVRYSQIFLRLAELAEEMDRKEMVKALRKQNVRKFQLEQVKKIKDESVLEFPNGTNLFAKPNRSRFKPARKF